MVGGASKVGKGVLVGCNVGSIVGVGNGVSVGFGVDVGGSGVFVLVGVAVGCGKNVLQLVKEIRVKAAAMKNIMRYLMRNMKPPLRESYYLKWVFQEKQANYDVSIGLTDSVIVPNIS